MGERAYGNARLKIVVGAARGVAGIFLRMKERRDMPSTRAFPTTTKEKRSFFQIKKLVPFKDYHSYH